MKIPSLTAEHGIGPAMGLYLGRPPSGGNAPNAVIPAAVKNVQNVTIWPRNGPGTGADTTGNPLASGNTGTYDDTNNTFAATLANPGALAMGGLYAALFVADTGPQCRLVTCTWNAAPTPQVDFTVQGNCSWFGPEVQ
jgi:hypothetical protein